MFFPKKELTTELFCVKIAGKIRVQKVSKVSNVFFVVLVNSAT